MVLATWEESLVAIEAQRRTIAGLLETPAQQMHQELSALSAEQYRTVRKQADDWLGDKQSCGVLGVSYSKEEGPNDVLKAKYVAMQVIFNHVDLRRILYAKNTR